MTIGIETETRAELTMAEAINRALREALEGDEPVMLLGQDIGLYGGTFGVTRHSAFSAGGGDPAEQRRRWQAVDPIPRFRNALSRVGRRD